MELGCPPQAVNLAYAGPASFLLGGSGGPRPEQEYRSLARRRRKNQPRRVDLFDVAASTLSARSLELERRPPCRGSEGGLSQRASGRRSEGRRR